MPKGVVARVRKTGRLLPDNSGRVTGVASSVRTRISRARAKIAASRDNSSEETSLLKAKGASGHHGMRRVNSDRHEMTKRASDRHRTMHVASDRPGVKMVISRVMGM